MNDKRPSDRELIKRLNEAKEYLKNRAGLFANPSKVVGELNELGIGDSNDVWQLIRELLEEFHQKITEGQDPLRSLMKKQSQGLNYWPLAGGALNVLYRCI